MQLALAAEETAARTILLVEDDPSDAELVVDALETTRAFDFDLIQVEALAATHETIENGGVDVVLLDLHLLDTPGVETWDRVRGLTDHVPIVVMSGLEDEELASRIIHSDAQDYLVKGQVDPIRLALCLARARERHRIESDLRTARAETLRALEAKSDFLASMSHEIRTPLNTVLGMTDLLTGTDLDGEQKQYVQICRSAGEILLEQINGILDLSKIEAGCVELESVSFDLCGLLDATIRMMSFPAHRKELALAYEVPSELRRRFVGDPARLRQVLINLVGNAIKFTLRGEIVVSVAVAREAQGEFLHFSVRDTGVGVPLSKQERIFESFTQADSSITRRFGGTGLGLSLSRRIAELMGGRLWMESSEGRGSTFHFTAEARPDTLSATLSNPATAGDARSVLVACKHSGERNIVSDLMAERGARVEAVASTRACLEAARFARERGEPFDLLLIDCRLPEKGAFELIQTARSELPGDVVVMFTADHRPNDISDCTRLGLTGWIVKPISAGILEDVLSGSGNPIEVAEAPPDSRAARPLDVLLVDDSEDNRNLITAFLGRSSHHLHCAENGVAAVERFKAESFDLVLLDIQMPERTLTTVGEPGLVHGGLVTVGQLGRRARRRHGEARGIS